MSSVSAERKPPSRSCQDKAFELLARRAHFTRELRLKLESRNYPPDEIEATLEQLAAAGHLDDAGTAEIYVAGRLRRGSIGPRRLIAELHQRGVDSELARAVVAAQIDDESELALAAAGRWRRGRSARQATPAALARHLERAGFRAELVAQQVRGLRAELAEAVD